MNKPPALPVKWESIHAEDRLLQFRLELILGDDWWHDHQLKSSCAYSSQEPWGNLQDLDLSCGDTKGCVETEDFGIPVWATTQDFFRHFGACI
jgi:hypothetical protein